MTEQSDLLREERHRELEEKLKKRTTNVVVSGNPSISEKSPAIQEAEKRNIRIITGENVPSGFKYHEGPNLPKSPSTIQNERGKSVR